MDTTTPAGKGLDNRVKSRLNQERVLLILNRFGWLPVRQVHQACWPGELTARNAQRYLAQLLTLKQVTVKKGPDGSRVYGLTSQGTRRLRVELGVEATYDSDFARRAMPTYYHRCLANDVVIWWGRKHGGAANFYTEHEIVTGRAPITSAPKYLSDPLGKIPDSLLTLERPVTDDNPYAMWLAWVEVEYSDKPAPAHRHMVRALCDVLGFGKQPLEVGSDSIMKLAVVVCPRAEHEYKLAQGVLQFLSENVSNYNVVDVLNRLSIWRPGAQDIFSLRQWIDERPAFLALRDKLHLWWSAPD